MKVMYMGEMTKEGKRRGCGVCGSKRTESGMVLTTMRNYFVPSGRMISFRVGQTEEVSDKDGAFLLQYRYELPSGEVRSVFEEVS